jgi:hypothetical protein
MARFSIEAYTMFLSGRSRSLRAGLSAGFRGARGQTVLASDRVGHSQPGRKHREELTAQRHVPFGQALGVRAGEVGRHVTQFA